MVPRMGYRVPRRARRQKRLKELAAQHDQVHEDDDGNIRVGKKAEREFRRDWEAGRFRGLRRDIGHGPETADEWRRRTRPANGHAPRTGDNERQHGSKRGDRSSSSSSDDPDPDPEPRTCEWCGASIEHLKRGARYCPGSVCRAAAWRAPPEEAFEPLTSVSRPCDKCPHLATLPDEDGDLICVQCATLVGTPSSPNGYEAVFALMITDADGQYRRLHSKRRRGTGHHFRRTPRSNSSLARSRQDQQTTTPSSSTAARGKGVTLSELTHYSRPAQEPDNTGADFFSPSDAEFPATAAGIIRDRLTRQVLAAARDDRW